MQSKTKFFKYFPPVYPEDFWKFDAWILPAGEIVYNRMHHARTAFDYGFTGSGVGEISKALKAGWVRLSSDGTMGRYVEMQNLKKSLPIIQKALTDFYEREGDSHLLVEERKSGNVWPVKLSTLVLGTEYEVRHGVADNPKSLASLESRAERILRGLVR